MGHEIDLGIEGLHSYRHIGRGEFSAVYAAYEQDRSGEDVMTAGYRREFGENLAFIVEARDDPQNGFDPDETKKEYAAGLSIKF